MFEKQDYFSDAIPIAKISDPNEIRIALFCHRNFCHISLPVLFAALEERIAALEKAQNRS